MINEYRNMIGEEESETRRVRAEWSLNFGGQDLLPYDLTERDYLEMAEESENRAKEYEVEPPLDYGDNPKWLYPTLRNCHADNLRIRKIRAKECRQAASEFRKRL